MYVLAVVVAGQEVLLEVLVDIMAEEMEEMAMVI